MPPYPLNSLKSTLFHCDSEWVLEAWLILKCCYFQTFCRIRQDVYSCYCFALRTQERLSGPPDLLPADVGSTSNENLEAKESIGASNLRWALSFLLAMESATLRIQFGFCVTFEVNRTLDSDHDAKGTMFRDLNSMPSPWLLLYSLRALLSFQLTFLLFLLLSIY